MARRFITAALAGLLALALALPAAAGLLSPGRSAYPADPTALLLGSTDPLTKRPISGPADIKTPLAIQWILGPGGFANGQAVDALGDETRTQHPGLVYVFDGVNDAIHVLIGADGDHTVSALNPDGTVASNVTIAFDTDHYVITSTVGQSIWNIKVWDSAASPSTADKQATTWDGDLWAAYWGDEGAGTTAFDHSGNGRHGTITNATLSSFHATHAGVSYSHQNEVGGSTGLYNNAQAMIATDIHPTASGALEIEFITPPVVPSGWGIGAMGAAGTRCYLGLAAGKLAAGIASQHWATIQGTTAIEPNTYYRGRVEWDGSTVRLLLNDVEEYNAAQSGAVPLDQPFYLLANNNNGSRDSPLEGAILRITIENAAGVVEVFDLNKGSGDKVTGRNGTTYKITDNTVPYWVTIPRDESTPAKDIAGRSLDHSGRVKYNADLVSPCGTLDGVDDHGIISGPSFFNNHFAEGGKLKFKVNVSSSSAADGRFFTVMTGAATSSYYLGHEGLGGGLWKFGMAVYTSGNLGYWRQATAVLPCDVDLEIEVDLNSSTLAAPILKVDGVPQALVELQTPTGSARDETGGDVYIGSTSSPSSHFKGSIFGLTLLDNSDNVLDIWPIQEGAGTTSYGQQGNHIAWQNISSAAFWAASQSYPDNYCHWAITQGFRASGGVEIPALADGSLAADDNAITNPAGKGHNGGKARLTMVTIAPALAGIPWWSTARGYADIAADYEGGHQVMADVLEDKNRRNLTVFNAPLTPPALGAVDQFLRH